MPESGQDWKTAQPAYKWEPPEVRAEQLAQGLESEQWHPY